MHVDQICTWFMQNGMMINAGKTELILCGDRCQLKQIPEMPSIRFMDQSLTCANTVKNLGVIMAPVLSWEPHVKHITDRCIGILVALLHAKHLLPVTVLPRVVDALVFSHLRYCVQVYGSANQTVIFKLQKVFNFAARVLSGRRKYDHISDVLCKLRWLNAQQFVDYFDICLLHKILVTGEPCALRSTLSFNHESVPRRTRQSAHLALGRVRTNHGKRLFTYRAAALYNRLVIDGDFDGVSFSAFKIRARSLVYHA